MKKSILQFLGLNLNQNSSTNAPAVETVETNAVQQIVLTLEDLEPKQARYLAAFAYVLSRVAHADSKISEKETQKMEEILQKLGHLPEAQAALVVEMAKHQTKLFGGTENFLVTREFKELSTLGQRKELLECIFAVSAADQSINTIEESQLRQISKQLGFNHNEHIEVQKSYSQHRDVLKSFRKIQS